MQALDRIAFSNNWLTLLFVFVLVLIVFLKAIDQQKLVGYSKALFLKGFVAKKIEEKESFFNAFNLVLLLFSSIVYAILISFFAAYFLNYVLSFVLFISIYSFVLAYLLIFILLDKIIASLFEIQHEVSYLFSSKTTYFYSIALLLFPLLIVTCYSEMSTFILFCFFIGFFLLSALLLFLNNKNLIINKLFYFILYLCALQVAPLLIIYKITA